MSKYLSFESDRLHIRPTTEEDAELILAIFTAPKAIRFIGDRNLHSEEDARNYIRRRTLTQMRKLGFANYTLVLKSTGQKVGVCGLYSREDMPLVDLGYALLPTTEGHGYIRESAMRIMKAAKEDFGQQKLSAITSPANHESIRVLEALGFEHKGRRKVSGYEGASEYFEVEL